MIRERTHDEKQAYIAGIRVGISMVDDYGRERALYVCNGIDQAIIEHEQLSMGFYDDRNGDVC